MAYPDTPPTADDISNNPQLKRELFEAFNNKPKDAINRIKDICGDNGLDDTGTRQKTASFLLNNKDNLDLELVSDYLGSDGPEQTEVRKHYLDQYAPNMAGKPMVTAMRDFADTCGMPKEGQKIARLISDFGAEYGKQRPELGIADGPSGSKLALMAVTVATDAHNPGVKNKMTLEQMKYYMSGENAKKDFNPELMQEIYEGVTKAPLELSYKKVEQGFELKSSELKKDPMLKAVDKELGNKEFNPNKTLGMKDATASVEGKKPWYGGLTGYKSSVTITDKDGNKATIEVSKPGFFSKKEPTVTIKPGEGPGGTQLAAELTNKFKAGAEIKASYAYQREDMTKAMNQQKAGVSTGEKEEVDSNKVELSREGQRNLQDVGLGTSTSSSEKLEQAGVKATVEVKALMNELRGELELRNTAKEKVDGEKAPKVGQTSGLKSTTERTVEGPGNQESQKTSFKRSK